MWTSRRSGQTHKRGENDHRNPYERDSTRAIHCPAFRRLQRKTQILGTDEGDFHRTRLTHSLEVASIGRSVVRHLAQTVCPKDLASLFPHDDLMHVICLLHDIGHPPFGHGGEVALNYMMAHHCGFEGNAQTLRLLTKIENSYGAFGLDLTRRTLLGILKYPVPLNAVLAKNKKVEQHNSYHSICINDWLPPKGYYQHEQEEVDWILALFSEDDKLLFQKLKQQPTENTHGYSAYQSFDCSIMNVADDIAYGVHDLEDAIHLRLIRREQFEVDSLCKLLQATSLAQQSGSLLDMLFHPEIHVRKRAIGEMVNYFITATEITAVEEGFEHSLLRYNATLPPEAFALLQYLKQFIFEYVIDSQEARTFEYGGQTVVQRLFEAISSNPGSLLDLNNRRLYFSVDNDADALRVVCDYIANMTDEYAYRMHERLFGFNTRTIFERL